MGMNWINWPLKVEMNPNGITIDGVKMSYMVFAETVNQIFHPDPRKWFRLEREGDVIQIHVRLTEEEPNGTHVGTTGSSEENPGASGTQTPHP